MGTTWALATPWEALASDAEALVLFLGFAICSLLVLYLIMKQYDQIHHNLGFRKNGEIEKKILTAIT